MSAHDLVVARIRDALHAMTHGPTDAGFRLVSFGSERRGEQHYVVARGLDFVTITIRESR